MNVDFVGNIRAFCAHRESNITLLGHVTFSLVTVSTNLQSRVT